MNDLPLRPTRAEIAADAAVHAIGLALAVVGVAALAWIAIEHAGIADAIPIAVYALGLLAMLGCSAAYNLFRRSRHRPLLQRLDHAAIFAMIAGTYTPFTVSALTGFWSWGLTTAVWSAAGLGIAAKLRGWRWPTWLWTPLYLVVGWLILIAVVPLSEAVSRGTLILICVGGGLYSAGVVFHVWERLKFQNAVWHGFVVAAAGTHYAAVVSLVATL
jgi:hemolysin III